MARQLAARVMLRQVALGGFPPNFTVGSSRPEMESWRSSEEGEGEEEHSEVLIREGKGKAVLSSRKYLGFGTAAYFVFI